MSKLTSMIAVIVVAVASQALCASENYNELSKLPAEKRQNDFWNANAYGGVTVDTSETDLTGFVPGGREEGSLLAGSVPAEFWFFPFFCHTLESLSRPLDPRTPSGLFLVVQ